MLRCLIGASETFDRAEKLTQSIGMKLQRMQRPVWRSSFVRRTRREWVSDTTVSFCQV